MDNWIHGKRSLPENLKNIFNEIGMIFTKYFQVEKVIVSYEWLDFKLSTSKYFTQQMLVKMTTNINNRKSFDVLETKYTLSHVDEKWQLTSSFTFSSIKNSILIKK